MILYTRQDFEAEVKRLTGGKGVDVVYDSVGKDTFDKSLNCLRRAGCMVLFGRRAGRSPPFDPQILNAKGSLYLTRPSLDDYIATREELVERAGDVLGWIADGQAEAARRARRSRWPRRPQAHRDLEGRKTTGKVLLIP